MDKKTKGFRKSLEALKRKVAVFREYSHVALVNVLDVTTNEDEFSISFKLSNAKAKDDPITIGSVWSNASIEKNGFSIAYVGSQMLIAEDAVAEFKEITSKLKSDKDKIDLFRSLLDGDSLDVATSDTLTKFNITINSCGIDDGNIPNQSWSFQYKNGLWNVVRFDHHNEIDGKKKIKHKMLVSPKSISGFLAILHGTTIPIALQFESGCDGGYTTLEYSDAGGGLGLSWWSVPPKELDALDKAINELLEELIDA